MCKYVSKPSIVDAEQFLCELGKVPTFIPNGVYKKTTRSESTSSPKTNEWGVDGITGFTKVEHGDWIVKYSDSKYYKVFNNTEFYKKFEKSVWQS